MGLAWGPDLWALDHVARRNRASYRAERRLRNQVERQYGVPTPPTFGPEQPPDVDPRGVLWR